MINGASDIAHAVVAPLRYVRADSEQPVFYVGAPGVRSRWVGQYETVNVPIQDARSNPQQPSLSIEGFELIHHGTSDVDFADDEEIATHYYPQLVELMRAQTGADSVVVFDHTLRIDNETPDIRKPVRHVHNDYSGVSAVRRIFDTLGETEALRRLRGTFVQLNFWRPINHPAETSQLALGVRESFSPEDFVKAAVVYEDRQGEVLEVIYQARHRWQYFSSMEPHEAALFVGFDSALVGGHAYTAHSGFDHPSPPLNAKKRESIEFRAFAFFETCC